MTKTLVALYETVTTAEQVVQELIAEGFARSDIHLALDHTTSHAAHNATGCRRRPTRVHTWWRHSLTLACRMTRPSPIPEGVRRGGALVVVESSEERAERGMAILQRLHPVNIHERTAQWQQEGWTGAEAHARTAATTATATPGTQGRPRTPQRGTEDTEVRIPVVEEDISVSKRAVEHGHVRIYSRVTEHPVEEAVRLREEKVTVERGRSDRPATDADFAAAAEQQVIEMTETVEEPVINKQARVVEEVVVHKEVDEHTETVRGRRGTPRWRCNGRLRTPRRLNERRPLRALPPTTPPSASTTRQPLPPVGRRMRCMTRVPLWVRVRHQRALPRA